MKTLTVEQQIDYLRPMLGFAALIHKWLLLGAALGVIASLLYLNPIPLMFSIFLAVVGFAQKRAGPNIVAAISAYDSKAPSLGNASIAVACWDMDNHYHVKLDEEGNSAWTYEFIPQGWQPRAGSYVAKIWRNGLEKKPVLSIVEEGIMIPRYDPQAISE